MRRLLLSLTFALLSCSGGEVQTDASVVDAGALDSGARDAGTRDAGRSAEDAGARDAGSIDAGEPRDGGARDGGIQRARCAFAGASDLDHFAAVLECLAAPDESEQTKRAFIADFVAAVEANEGFPIATPTGAVFVYVRTATFDAEDDKFADEDFAPSRRSAPISVAGDFDMWAPGVDVLQDAGFDFFHGEVPIDSNLFPRARYKLVAKDAAGDDVWFSDPLSRRYDFDANGRISIVRGGLDQGHLEWLRDVNATMLGVSRNVVVYVPPGYDADRTARYPVLYMHDGNNLFDSSQPFSAPSSWDVDAVFEAELDADRLRPGIIVGIPNNANRFDEYTHVPDDFGQGTVGGDGDLYAHFVAEQLKPLIDRRYRTRADRANTGVLGSSLGGLVSFHIGAQYPNVFRFVGGMSSTFYWGRFGANGPTMVERYEAIVDLDTRDQIFYLDSGGGPGGGCDAGGGSDNYCVTLDMRTTLTSAGVSTFPDDPDAVPLTPTDFDILHWWTPDAPHNEASWNARVHRPLRMFFRR